jgi:hypothetical protein
MDTTQRQKNYVETMKRRAPGAGIVFADAFLRGMRDIGYKNPAWAIAELVDNAMQASATTVEICYGFKEANTTESKPNQIAIVDDGNGMIPDMIGYAVRWGGTDREDDRSGFGRYGYGLPTSAVSLACRYTVYSKIAGSNWHAVSVDISKIAGSADSAEKIEKLLTPQKKSLPRWILEGTETIDLHSIDSGTVIVLEDLDRLKRLPGWVTRKSITTKLHQHLGVIYRHWMPERSIFVDRAPTQVVDPLFLMEHGRLFDETSDRAIRFEARTFDVSTAEGRVGAVRIRASLLPPTFQRVDPLRTDSSNTNSRWPIMREYNALLICREGRQIDSVPPRWTKFQTYDANIKVEIDFDASLDEFFGITTAKQQITIAESMWEKLLHNGKGGGALIQLVKDLRAARDRLIEKDEAVRSEAKAIDGRKASEQAMEEAEKFKLRKREQSVRKREEGRKNLQNEAQQIAAATGRQADEVLKQLEGEAKEHRWRILFDAVKEGPFFSPLRLGEQKRVVLNTNHPFYQKVYEPHPQVRSALEVLLLVLADGELEAEGASEVFYKAARQSWSERLRHALDALVSDQALSDKANAVAEALYTDES